MHNDPDEDLPTEEQGATATGHVPVLPAEILEYLGGPERQCIVDCTLGLAGHAVLLLERNPTFV
ncbi:MAG: 16S rRNA (cytosine(1402)-N(4))-methyltransferase [Planctomycetes bacterium]|nr:16S rRNA (cytosine(1402)-N(4))-methyltransferase [Planctomycetota bacterium]